MRAQIIRVGLILGVAAALIFGVGYLYRTGPQAAELVWNEDATRQPKVPILVEFDGDFAEPSSYAIGLWNGLMPPVEGGRSQDLFRSGGNLEEGDSVVRILSANGEPCGDPWRPEVEDGHSATAYQCPAQGDGIDRWEVQIGSPGDVHTQFCIVAHELGHVLGLADDARGVGVMNQRHCAGMVRVSDKDREAVIKRYENMLWFEPEEFERLQRMNGGPK